MKLGLSFLFLWQVVIVLVVNIVSSAYLIFVFGHYLCFNNSSFVFVQLFQAEKEPILSSFLYASILSHDCLERALGFVLANRLQNPTLLATQLKDIFDNVVMHDRGIQHAIRLDIQVISWPHNGVSISFYTYNSL